MQSFIVIGWVVYEGLNYEEKFVLGWDGLNPSSKILFENHPKSWRKFKVGYCLQDAHCEWVSESVNQGVSDHKIINLYNIC